MWLISPLFQPLMGMESSTICSMMPVSERREGAMIDASITNPDMMRNFMDSYNSHLQDLENNSLFMPNTANQTYLNFYKILSSCDMEEAENFKNNMESLANIYNSFKSIDTSNEQSFKNGYELYVKCIWCRMDRMTMSKYRMILIHLQLNFLSRRDNK